MLLATVLLIAAAAPLGLFAGRIGPVAVGWVLALLPAGLCAFLALLPVPFAEANPWAPALGLELALRLDGLSLVFALLITGIGALVLGYSGHYLAHDPAVGRFLCFLMLFMAAMLGLVLADNLLLLFVCWELTSVTSFLLIGHNFGEPAARRGAQQALLVTSAGGLALLAGLLLLAMAAAPAGASPADSYRLSVIVGAGARIVASPLGGPAAALVILGCCAKSAQFPLHFWLPNAMQAPTPASAYLHSATMVKAGIYLLARLAPALHSLPFWSPTLITLGGITLLLGALLALRQFDLKALLAYTTLSQLGALVLLIGVGGEHASQALVLGVLTHALYKCPLFLVAGIVDHATGTRDLRRLGGLLARMPRTAALAALAGLSMAGLPPMLGFVFKELQLDAPGHSPLPIWAQWVVLAAMTVAAAASVAAAWRYVAGTFGKKVAPRHEPPPTQSSGHGNLAHDPATGMLIAPALPAALSLLLGLALPATARFLEPAATAMAGVPIHMELALWHGFSLPLLLSAVAIAGGAALALALLPSSPRVGEGAGGEGSQNLADHLYDRALDATALLALRLVRATQGGKLRIYVATMLLALLAIVGLPLIFVGFGGVTLPPADHVQPHEAIAALLIPLGVIATIRARSRLGAIIAVGVVGAMVSLFFALFSAPDLALTQLLIETLSVVFLLLVFYVLPTGFERRSPLRTRYRDALIAVAVGTLMAGLTIMAAGTRLFPSIADYYMAQSLPKGKGANVVNVILVDFRGFDTMGEITVLFLAALGIYGLLRMHRR